MARAEQVTIAALGDSLTQGYGLPADDGLVPQLQRWLTEHGADVKLLNAGVSGDTTAGGLARAEWTMTAEVDGLILTLGGNDMLRGIDPDTARQNLDGILAIAAGKNLPVLLVGQDTPTNYGAEYKQTFDKVYPDLAAKYDTLLLASFLSALTDDTDRAEILQKYMQPDAIHPNAEGVKIIVSAIGPSVLELIEQIE